MRTVLMTGEIELPLDAQLGPGAVAFVHVEDASVADAAATVVGEQRIPDLTGPQNGRWTVPFSFPVSIEDEGRRLIVRAHISQQGERDIHSGDYLTVQSIPVLTGGHGDHAAVPVTRV